MSFYGHFCVGMGTCIYCRNTYSDIYWNGNNDIGMGTVILVWDTVIFVWEQ